MPSKKITNMPDWAGAQVPTDLLTGVDLSQPANLENVKTTLNDLFATITKNISDISLQFQNGVATATVSAAGQGKIRYNDTTKTFQFSADGGAYAGFGSPGGSNLQIQYNNSGAFGGAIGVTFDPTGDARLNVQDQGGFTNVIAARENGVTPVLVAGFPALLTVQTVDANNYWHVAYINETGGKIANFLSDSGDLIFTFYDLTDTQTGAFNFLQGSDTRIQLENANANACRIGRTDTLADFSTFDTAPIVLAPNTVRSVYAAMDGVITLCPDTPLADGVLNNNELHFSVDEGADNLNVKVKYSDGSVHTASIALTP
jgi:hypothetical protein